HCGQRALRPHRAAANRNLRPQRGQGARMSPTFWWGVVEPGSFVGAGTGVPLLRGPRTPMGVFSCGGRANGAGDTGAGTGAEGVAGAGGGGPEGRAATGAGGGGEGRGRARGGGA